MTSPAPEEIAVKVANSLFQADRTSQSLDMAIQSVTPGAAILTMTVREDMLNGHGTCHGGILFTLADSAFAFGCNSYNHVTVAQGCEIDYLRPAKPGDVLTATCKERAVAGRSGIYDVEITNQEGDMIALFRGKSRRIRGTVVPGLTTVE